MHPEDVQQNIDTARRIKIFRDKVLGNIQSKEPNRKDKEIKILKHIPWQIRQKRKQYAKLTSLGALFEFQDQSYYINSKLKAEDFMKTKKM